MKLMLRLKNKASLTAIIAAIVAAVYQILSLFSIVPAISQDAFVQTCGLVVNVLVLLGIVVDPTTPGIEDSEVTKQKESINDTAKDVVMRNLTNEDMAEILSKTVKKEEESK